MLAQINNNRYHVEITPQATKHKPCNGYYTLNMLFVIKENGWLHGSTQFSLKKTIRISEWGGKRKKSITKINGIAAHTINDMLDTDLVKAKDLLIRANGLTTPPQIINYIQTEIRTQITGAPVRGLRPTPPETTPTPHLLTIDEAFNQLKLSIRKSEKVLGDGRTNIYVSVIKKFHQFFNNQTPPVIQITKQNLRDFKNWYYFTCSHRMETKSTYLGCIASIFNYLVETEKIPFSPIPKHFTPTVKRGAPEKT